MRIQFCWICDMELLETFQQLEKRLARIGCKVARAASDHTEVGTKAESFFDSVEIRPERNSALLPELVVIEIFMWLRRFL